MNASAEVEESSSATDSYEDERRKIKGKQMYPCRSNDIKNYNTVDLGFFEDEELYKLFCENKTKISTIKGPVMFLRHLKDYRLITDELYKKLVNCDDAVYDALESIEKRGAKKIRKFWKCVQQEHILQHYSQLSEIAATLKNSLENGSSKKARERSEDGGTGKGKEVKKRRTEDHSVSNQAGPSSQSTNSQREKFEHVEKGSLKKALKNEPSKKARERSEDGGTGKGKEVKKRRTEDHSVSNQAGPPSSQSTNSQREKFKHVEKGSLKKALKNEPSKKARERSEDGGTGKGKEVKKRRTEDHSVSNQAGPPSSQSTNSQREKFKHVEKGSLKKALKNEPSKKARERSEDGGTGKGKEVKKRRTEDHSVSNQAGPPSSQSTNSQREKFKHVEKGSLKKAFKNGLSKKTRERSKDGGTGKGKEVKKRRTEPVSYSVSNQAGPPSSQSSNSQREKSEHVYREEEKDLWDTQKRWLPVTCGEKKALLDREALRTYGRKNSKCIKYRKQMITPYQYEEMAGKEKSKNWKISVLYQGRKIKDLLKEGFLEMPEKKKKLAVNDVA